MLKRRTRYRLLMWLIGAPVLMLLLLWVTGELWTRPETRDKLPLFAGAAVLLLLGSAWISVRRRRG